MGTGSDFLVTTGRAAHPFQFQSNNQFGITEVCPQGSQKAEIILKLKAFSIKNLEKPPVKIHRHLPIKKEIDNSSNPC